MSHIIDQVDDEEVDPLSQQQIADAYRAHKRQLGGPPPDDEELSAEQLTTLHALFRSGRAPYVDMAIWGPFQLRIQKKIKLKGTRFIVDGDMVPVELYGPADYESWRECFQVYRTGAVMLEEIYPSTLDGYEKVVRHYHERYGKGCWPIIYQADVRARLEHVERVRRRGQEAYDRARQAGLTHDFDPAKPWDWVYRRIIGDFPFWQKECLEPCLMMMAKTTPVSSLVGQDAPLSGPAGSVTAPASSSRTPPPPAAPARPAKRQRGPDVRERRLGDDGLYSHNRRGKELRKMFQSGECKEGPERQLHAQQCAKCLSEMHGADQCPLDVPRPPRARMERARGRGKGASDARRMQPCMRIQWCE